jgi:ADP-ribose pyrophosphatase
VYEVQSSELVLSRYNFDVIDAQLRAEDGTISRSWVKHPPTVATVAVTDDGRVPLLSQYRPAISGWNLELPGGRIDGGDRDPASAALRELREEAGVIAHSIEQLGQFLNAPAHCTQRTLLFLATGIREVPRQPDPDEEATSRVEFVELAESDQLIATGVVRDAKTIIGLLLAARRRTS